MPEGSPSVLIIRLDGIGDALALTPLLAAFRRRAIPVDLVLRRGNAAVFASHAGGVTIADIELRSTSGSNLAAIERLGKRLRAHQYSHVLVATEDPGGYRLAAAIGAPVRIGFSDLWRKPLKAVWSRRLLTKTIYRSAGLDPRGLHECEVLFALAQPLVDGAPTRDLAELRPLVIDAKILPDEAIAVQITDKYERAGLAFDSVVEMIHRLAAMASLHLLSARFEAAYAQRIARATGHPLTLFDEIEPWKAAIAAAPAIVTPDSGASHVAGMIGTPVVAIFPPHPTYELEVARWAPWAAPHRIVRADSEWPVRTTDALTHLLST